MTTGTVHLSDLLSFVRPFVNDCPDLVSCEQLRLAARRYCYQTRVWRFATTLVIADEEKTVASDTVIALEDLVVAATDRTTDRPLEFPDYAAIVKIEHAKIGYTVLQPIAYKTRAGESDGASGGAAYISQVNDNTVDIWPFQTGNLHLSLFLMPRNGVRYGEGDDLPWQNYYDRLPEFVARTHGEKIALGAVARLKMQPRTDWYDPDGASVAEGQFQRAMLDHSSDHHAGQQEAPPRTRSVWF